MKEIKILIRIDEANNKVGFAIEKDSKEGIVPIMELISLLELLKQEQIKKMNRFFSSVVKK